MRDNKAFASLSSGLLARKGQARPAMRPQGFGQGMGQPDDLGWNDMGHDVPRVAGATLPANLAAEPALPPVTPPVVVAVPEVIRQQDVIAREFAASVEAEPVVLSLVELAKLEEAETQAVVEPVTVEAAAAPVSFAPAKQPRRKSDRKPVVLQTAVAKPAAARHVDAARKAAFTLRLDTDRHLLLRLACAVQNRSAQQIVIEALDRLLADLPDVARLAASLPGKD